MPFATVAIAPGVKVELTPTLLGAGIAQSQLIRHRQSLVEKLGGWSKFFPLTLATPIRDLHAWEDINTTAHLSAAGEAKLAIITNGSETDITPATKTNNPAVSFSTTNGSAVVEILDANISPTIYMVVNVLVPVAIGGLIIQGLYQITAVTGAHSFRILADSNATSTVVSGGAVPAFTTTNGSPNVSVALTAHGLTVGQSFQIAVLTTVGGLPLFGVYVVQTVPTANAFTINATSAATSATSGSENGGNARLTYYITAGPVAVGTGYGVGLYGLGGYGTGAAGGGGSSGTVITAVDWTQDNWGEILLACPQGGPVFQWSPDSGYSTATIVLDAPIANGGIFISMPAQILVCWGAALNGVQDPLLIKWSDAGDYTNFTVTSQTQAGSFRIPTGSKLVAGMVGPQQSLFWTDTDLWLMQYIEPPLIFGFLKVGTFCGAISSHSWGTMSGMVYWMGLDSFYLFDGSRVRNFDCDVWDVIFQDLDTDNAYKVRCGTNSGFDEITWYFPSLSGGTGENDKYVKVNISANPPQWDYGTLQRTAFIDQNVFGEPIGATAAGVIYQHEVSNDADGQAMNSYIVTGYFTLQEGEDFVFLDQFIPDAKYGQTGMPATAELLVTFNVTDWPNATPRTYGPMSISAAKKFISPRLRGRQISLKLESNDVGSWWRLGKMRFRFRPDGQAAGNGAG